MPKRSHGVWVTHAGGFTKLDRFLLNVQHEPFDLLTKHVLNKYGKLGVEALSAATPRKTGKTAESWHYEIEDLGDGNYILAWTNDNLAVDGTPIAIYLNYGHGLKNGGYVAGRYFIKPALQKLFEDMPDAIWKEITSK